MLYVNRRVPHLQECRVVPLHAGYWGRAPVRQQCVGSVVLCTAHNSAWRLCIGRIRGPRIIRKMLSRIDKAMSQDLPFVGQRRGTFRAASVVEDWSVRLRAS